MTTPLIEANRADLIEEFGVYYQFSNLPHNNFKLVIEECLGEILRTTSMGVSAQSCDLDQMVEIWESLELNNFYQQNRRSLQQSYGEELPLRWKDAPSRIKNRVVADAQLGHPDILFLPDTVPVPDMVPDRTTVYRVFLPTLKTPKLEIRSVPARLEMVQTGHPHRPLGSGAYCSATYRVDSLIITPTTGDFDEAHPLVFKTRSAAERFTQKWVTNVLRSATNVGYSPHSVQ